MPDRLFLDANVIFSAAYHPSTALRRLWSVPEVALLTTSYAITEASRNLPPARHLDLRMLLQAVTLVPPAPIDRPLPPTLRLPAKDVPIFQAAATAEATHLLTGDKRHFGAYYGRRIEGVLILTPRMYLLSRP